MGEGGILAMGAGMIVFLVLFYLAYILVAMAQYASLISVASPLRQANFSDALSAGWRAAPALLMLMIVLIVCGLLMLPSIGLLTSMADPAAMAEVAPAFGSIALLFLSILVVSALFAILYSAFMAVIHGSLSTASGEGVVEAFA